MDIKRSIQKTFRGSGLFLSSQALSMLANFAEASGGVQDVVDSVIDAIEDRRRESK